MLVTFSSPVHSDVTMFADVAKRILKLMGQSGSIPGAVAAEDVPSVLEHLKNEVSFHDEGQSDSQDNGNENHEPTIGIAVRAFPLIEMLTAAAESESTVMWYQK